MCTPEWSSPVLPPELERIIFILAADSRSKDALSLLLVARRVQEWLEPILYRQFEIIGHGNREHLQRLAALEPSALQFVRHLSLRVRHDNVPFLALCSGVTHLALGSGALEVPGTHVAISALHQLRRLACHSRQLYSASPADFVSTFPVYATLTHLCLYDYPSGQAALSREDGRTEAFAAGLPSLTHFASYGYPTVNAICHMLSVFARPSISAVLVVSSSRRAAEGVSQDLDVTDSRFVVTTMRSWDEGTAEGDTFWDIADEFIARKRRGEIPVSVFYAARSAD
ncbi:hypothetical protein MKEN_00473100 [Mycena kentingensis (nom. inval.)]|nr:hypothetical protein MKEN_00473100 [Mycena kentingensis (nom. inval.)]